MSFAVNVLGAAVTVGLFLFASPAAGLVSALVFGIVAIRVANAEKRAVRGAGPANWSEPGK